MLKDRIEGKWIDSFVYMFECCNVKKGDVVAILSETQSREINVHLSELALLRIGARPFHIILPTLPQDAPVPVRSTGSSYVIGELEPVLKALTSVGFIADLTVEGVIHSPETPIILGSGARSVYISNEHPEVLERLPPNPALKPKIQAGKEMMQKAKLMKVTSKAGTDLTVTMTGARVGGNFGISDNPGQLSSWPGGINSCFPAVHSTNGVLVLDRGDINLTFKRYLENPIKLIIEDDFVVDIQGDHFDAEIMRSYFAAWGDKNAYGVSHVGWGMNPGARWDALIMYDKGEVNCTEQRAFAGNFLYSTGANPSAGRYTLGHYDLPVRNTTIDLDGKIIIKDGILQGELA
ncbi:MAG: peptidase M29 [Gammaproteobacteria bacterium]|nr:peptidase M29 [Gammaproteobacteria bacterium]